MRSEAEPRCPLETATKWWTAPATAFVENQPYTAFLLEDQEY
jgi:hypothetical protein